MVQNNAMLSWYLDQSTTEKAWNIFQGQDAFVTIFDTCIMTDHIGFENRVIRGMYDQCRIDTNQKTYLQMHGTAVASMIGASISSINYPCKTSTCDYLGTKAINVTGILPQIKIYQPIDLSGAAIIKDPLVRQRKLRDLFKEYCHNTLGYNNNACAKYMIQNNLQSGVISYSEKISLRKELLTQLLNSICDPDNMMMITMALGNTQEQINVPGLYLLDGLEAPLNCTNTIIKVAGINYMNNINALEEIIPFKNIDYTPDSPSIYAPSQRLNVFTNSCNNCASIEQGTSLATPLVASAVSIILHCNNGIQKDAILSTLHDASVSSDRLSAPALITPTNLIGLCQAKGTVDFNGGDDL